ncbi:MULTISPECIES: pitrilysin family protein [unclassified Polaromonas]|jgi:zinc protease|uniref:M16 family metallopeptidase n=1 Tax=unclassified Polaromonas TaxID=2638319 RepID=UPI0018C98348|nr:MULTISPECIES: pitrilysin family protein [unclassified Polaromonas]MBG6071973.1 zinc protease [Polaromonas sp. CG_9.7]MBG6113975.1 zinc protease [Polaromonas sp. CG_9.2]MDH6183893.1 zinc protease [Polaromonas sp. CG_23.6]
MKHLKQMGVKPPVLFFQRPASGFTGLLLSAALTAGLGQAAFAQAPATVEQFTLANGLTVIVKPDHRAPTVAHMLWVRVGAMDEVDGTSGVAHALEHMMFKGTPKVKAGEFSRRVAALGGQENAFTSSDSTGYYQQIPAAKLEDVMRLESDRFGHSQWPDEEFKREIEVVKEERRMRTEESPHAMLHEQASAITFLASPYRRPIVGWMSDLVAMTPDDVRSFYQRWYVPANAALVVAGDVNVAQVRKLAEKYYGAIPARPVPVRKPRTEPEQAGMRRIDLKAPASQAYVSMAFKVPKVQPADLAVAVGAASPTAAASREALALTVLSAVLDGYSGARLERALVQGRGQQDGRVADSAGASSGLIGRGPQLFTLNGVPADGKTTQQVADALRQQVAVVARDGVSEAELQRVKTQWVASETYKLDSVFSQARELGSNWVQGLPLDAGTRLIAQLRTVTSAEVQAVAGKYFGDDQMTVSTLLPQPLASKPKPRPANAAASAEMR